jgi:hypothetical protein
MSNNKPNNTIHYKRKNIEIVGAGKSAWCLMFIDLVTSRLTWMAIVIITVYSRCH